MDIGQAQMLLTAARLYDGGIDGVAGEKTRHAVRDAENTWSAQYRNDPTAWPATRRLIAAVQAALNAQGFGAGGIDGLEGHNTREALAAFLYQKMNVRREVVRRDQKRSDIGDASIPYQSEVASFYGRPGPDIVGQLVMITLPFDLRIDWNLAQTTRRIRVHRLAAPSLEAALIEVHDTYGPEEWRYLGLDRYAGAYNHRRMRGGDNWSMHAYGCAIDFFAQPNGLRRRCPEALFCSEEYQPFLDIMENRGWLPAIRLWGADAMHFQRARL